MGPCDLFGANPLRPCFHPETCAAAIALRGMFPARTLLRSRNARWQLRSLHSQRPTVGFVGAGNMGRGMAASLARAGLPVAQFDRDSAALAASAAASPLIEAVGRCASALMRWQLPS